MSDTPSMNAADRRTWWHKLQPFRFLAVVYGLAAAVGCWEFSQRHQKADLYLDPQASFADTFQELYPRSGEANYEKGMQATLCLGSQALKQPIPAACRQYEGRDLRLETRRRFEHALRTGIKSEEGLYYHYLQILIGSQAAPQKIDAAYQAWRKNFPLSKLADPRRTPP